MAYRQLVPKFILEKEASGASSGRFEGVALFVDTSGFTPLTVQLQRYGTAGAEQLAEILQAVFDPLIEIIYRHGGFITGFAGDAFKGVFIGVKTDQLRSALSAAVAIQSHMAANAIVETTFGDFPFAVRTSLANGTLEWGIWRTEKPIPNGQAAAYTFSGPALDQAIAGEALAKAGDLIMTDSVYAALTSEFDLVSEPISGSEKRFWRVNSVPSKPLM